jgi:peptide/nickel transport system substrate-binding protein
MMPVRTMPKAVQSSSSANDLGPVPGRHFAKIKGLPSQTNKENVMRRSVGLSAIAVLAAGTLALSGCSSGGGGGGAAESKTIIGAVGDNPPHFNRYLATAASTSTIPAGTIYEGLAHLNSDYEPEPWLAESWDIAPDGLTYTFHLRRDVKWHDGQPFTSDDVRFTIEKLMPLHSQLGGVAGRIASIETPDDNTITLKLSQPYAPLLAAFASAWIMPRHIFTAEEIAKDPANLQPVGTGPYKFEEFRSGERVTLRKNENYWGEVGDIDKIVFAVMPDTTARMLALKSGDINYLYDIYVDKSQLTQLSEAQFSRYDKLGGQPTRIVFTNTTRPEMSKPEVRRALFQAINRTEIADKALQAGGEASRGPIPSGFKALLNGEVDYNKDLPYDPAAAAAALDKAGYPVGADGKRFTLRFLYESTFSSSADAGALIKANLNAVGVDVQLEGLDSQVFAQKTFTSKEFDLAYMSLDSAEDPDLGVTRIYACNPKNLPYRNPTGLCDPAIDNAFNAAATATTNEKRAEHYAEAERLILAELPSMPIAFSTGITVVNKSIDMDKATSLNWTAWGYAKSR